MTSPAEALGLVLESVRALEGVSEVRDDSPRYAISAAPVRAQDHLPAADVSRMDGYAVRAPVAKGAVLAVHGETPAGTEPLGPFPDSACVRVFTGAALPAGANGVIEQESVSVKGAALTLGRDVQPGDFVTARGSVVAPGDEVLPAGVPLGPVQVAVAAAVGKAPRLRRVPAVSLFSTGRELVDFRQSPAPHQTRDSNTPALTAALEALGCRIASAQRVDDQLEALVQALAESMASADVQALITIGGVSVGDYDLVPEALRLAGAEIHLHRLAVKPGKPFLFATANGKPIFGLPGNPLSALASFFEFVAPALRKMCGRPQPWLPTLRVRLTAPAPGDAERLHLVLATVTQDAQGYWLAAPLPAAHSADLSVAARADGVVLVPQGRARLPEGETVLFHPWRPLW